MTGTGLSVAGEFSASDGILDLFVVSRKPLSIMAAEARFLQVPTWNAGLYCWRGREITIDAQPEQAIWMDGEYHGSSPVTAHIAPGALTVVAP
jgi:diacylglycerol kinase family enzyme